MTAKIIYRRGDRFLDTRLRYLDDSQPDKYGHRNIWVQCDCGVIKVIHLSSIRKGISTSCGCWSRERSTVHELISHWLYHRYHGILARCYNSANSHYKYYGAKGGIVCEEWQNFVVFKTWVESQGMTEKDDFEIHRKGSGNGGNYEPSNCVCMNKTEHQALHRTK